ncbi:hypothetical protein L6164_004739 [Bauhinia variegata]|uniref:Uncharacterized protein n=1 Tax=Bauhinia variegata TaxID=167791 RepID=A0ACB9PPA2_BAUVA|nr:hypothetical protein L6164_004739 [Bauhinia variegata]
MAIQAHLYPNAIGFPLYGSQDSVIDNGFAQSCFISQQKIQQQQLRQQNNERVWNQNMFFDTNVVVSNSKVNHGNNPNVSPMLNSQSLAAQFENQRQEIDQYIELKNENLRILLQEQRKQQLATLFKKLESQALYLLSQKDEELTQAATRKLQLEDFLRRLEAENQAWRRVAEENESMVLSLHNSLEEMKEKAFYHGFVAEDAESCCDETSEGTEENRVRDAEDQISRKTMMMVCRGCNSGSSSFLFLPCRHLSSCKACEPFLEACPVCGEPKKASIETFDFLG